MHANGERVSWYSLWHSLCRRALFGSAAGVLAVWWLAGCGRAAADTPGSSGNNAAPAWAVRWWIPISGGIAVGVAVLAGVMLVRRLRSGRDDSAPTGAGEQLALPPGQSEGSPESDRSPESEGSPESGGSSESDGSPESEGARQPAVPSASPAPAPPDVPQEPARIPVRGPAKTVPVMDPPVMDLRNQFERAKATSRALTADAQRYEDIYTGFGRDSASSTIKDLVVSVGLKVGLTAVVGLSRWPAGEEAGWEQVVATGWAASFHDAASDTIGSAVEQAK